MTEVFCIAGGLAAAAGGMWYWKREGIFSVQTAAEKNISNLLKTAAVICSLCFGILLGTKDWDILLCIKLLVMYGFILAVSAVDWKKRIIANRVIITAFAVRAAILIFEYVLRRDTFLQNTAASFWGFLFGFGFLFLVTILSKRSIGYGDVKLFAAIGIYVGFWGTFNVLFYSLFYCAVVSLVLMAAKKAGRKSRIPFAPFIYMGYATMVLFLAF